MGERFRVPLNHMLVAADATSAVSAAAIWLVWPDVPLFRALLYLFGFNLLFALIATVRSREHDMHALFDEGMRKVQIGVIVRMLYFVDANIPLGHGIDSPLGPLAAGWYIFDTVVNTLDAADKGKIPIGPLKPIMDMLRAKNQPVIPPSNDNPAAGGGILRP